MDLNQREARDMSSNEFVGHDLLKLLFITASARLGLSVRYTALSYTQKQDTRPNAHQDPA